MASRLVVEWTRLTVRIALADGDGARSRVRMIRSQTINSAGDIAGALRELLQDRPAGLNEVLAVIPREQVITRLVKFPATKSDELMQMVELYAKAQLPYPREQAVFDFHVVSQQDGFSMVAIVACQREVVDRQLAVLQAAGLSANALTVSSWGLLGWYRAAIAKRPIGEPCLVVNVDDSRTDLVLTAGGRVLSTRSVGQGVSDWQASGDGASLLAAEIDRSRAAIRKELPAGDIRTLVLTGMGPLAQWKDDIAQRLSLPVEIIDARQPFTDWTAPLNAAVSPVVVGGVACLEPKGLLNLSPVELKTERSQRRQLHELAMVGALFIGAMALGAGLLYQEIGRQRQAAAQLERALQELEPAAKRVQEHGRSAALVTSLLTARRHVADILANVFRSTPDTVALDAVNLEGGSRREVTIRGNAATMQDALTYLKRIQLLDGVVSAQLKYTSQRSTSIGERTDFEILARQK